MDVLPSVLLELAESRQLASALRAERDAIARRLAEAEALLAEIGREVQIPDIRYVDSVHIRPATWQDWQTRIAKLLGEAP